MGSDEEKRRRRSSLEHKKPIMPEKKNSHMRILEIGSVGALMAWGGALAFACLLAASTFKRNKKRGDNENQDGGSDLAASGLLENIGGVDEIAEMKGLRFFLQSPSTDCTVFHAAQVLNLQSDSSSKKQKEPLHSLEIFRRRSR